MEISKKSLQDAYEGNVIFFNLLEGLDKEWYAVQVKEQMKKIIEMQKEIKSEKEICVFLPQSVEEILSFRDAVGILRISQRRIRAWLLWLSDYYCLKVPNEETLILNNLLGILDRLYSTVKTYRLRKKINIEVIRNLLLESLDFDKRWLRNSYSCILAIKFGYLTGVIRFYARERLHKHLSLLLLLTCFTTIIRCTELMNLKCAI